MRTDFTRLLGLDAPVLQAPQSDPASVAAFSRAGGLGVLEAGPLLGVGLEMLRAESAPFAVHLPAELPDSQRTLLGAGPLAAVVVPAGGWAPPGPVVIRSAVTPEEAVAATGPGTSAILLQLADATDLRVVIRDAMATLRGLPLLVSAPGWTPKEALAALAAGAQAVQARAAGSATELVLVRKLSRDAGTDTADRAAREGAALRQNLLRRKQHSRTATSGKSDPPDPV